MEVPCIYLASRLWQEFAKQKYLTLHKVDNPTNTAEDIEFISCFVPYCDAAFLDKQMEAWLSRSKLWDGYGALLFSLNSKDQFLQYLHSLEKDHVKPISPDAFGEFEKQRLARLRQHDCPLLWICFVPTRPDDLIRSKPVVLENTPGSLVECRILPGGGIEWVEAISDNTKVLTAGLESMIQNALDQLFRVPREGSHVSMRIFYRLVNCAGMKLQNPAGSRQKKIKRELLMLGDSDWITESPSLHWPKPNEIMATLFEGKRAKL
jgi:hypothetical protein